MPKESRVGRANYAILAIGLASMLFLSMLMKYALQVADDQRRSPIADELTTAFGHWLDRPADVRIEQMGGERRAVLTLVPLPGAREEQLSREIGEYLWRRLGDESQLAAVEVLCKRAGESAAVRHAIPRPYSAKRPPRKGLASAIPPATPSSPGPAAAPGGSPLPATPPGTATATPPVPPAATIRTAPPLAPK